MRKGIGKCRGKAKAKAYAFAKACKRTYVFQLAFFIYIDKEDKG